MAGRSPHNQRGLRCPRWHRNCEGTFAEGARPATPAAMQFRQVVLLAAFLVPFASCAVIGNITAPTTGVYGSSVTAARLNLLTICHYLSMVLVEGRGCRGREGLGCYVENVENVAEKGGCIGSHGLGCNVGNVENVDPGLETAVERRGGGESWLNTDTELESRGGRKPPSRRAIAKSDAITV
ncbi:uncharacterized protein C8Q71DRAFT_318320 [Rhodofomes roseus]|uniref:Uncharacterized protein n=1 Tax=Rhodofomes roseus TaxID=34475 RepID=A0ABQ8K3A3_9APHY|nr:uncharacterized protein C8Q71DRAFT_318320 [Rhodofomes roseus]KAH9831021.1 hypothetical protein C8Q71DRAFT_318320 [Rhodofomes roseus]